MAIGNPINLTSNVEGKNISVIATAGQTQFTVTGGYRINQISVFRNGVRLVDGRDFTALDGSIVTLLSAATVADVIEFQVFDDFRVSDALSVNSGGTVNGNVTVTGILSTTNLSIGSSISLDATTGIITAVQVIGGTITGTATTAINAQGLTGTPDITVNNIVAAAGTFSGVLTYEDVTNIDSLGIVTARTGVDITANGLVVNAGVSTFGADLSIADKIIHSGDTNTAIRFPSNDTFTVETSGVQRLEVDSTGNLGLVGIATATGLVVVAGSGGYAGHTGIITAVTFDGALSGAATQVTVADESSDTTCFPLFATAATGNLPPKSGTNLTFNSSSGALTATSFVGAVTGDVTGNISGGTVAGSTGTFTSDVDIADKIIHTGDTNTAIRFPAADTFTVETAGSEAFRVTGDQRIGIGTADPLRQLEVYNSTNAIINLKSDTQSSVIFSDPADTNIGMLIYEHSSDSMQFRVNDAERARIDSSGNLIIGSTSAATNSQITLRSASPHLSLYGTPGSNTSQLNLGDTDDHDIGNISYDHSDNSMRFTANATERLRIDSLGNIGVNQTSVNSSRKMEITQPSSYTSGLRINSAGSSGNGAYFEVFVGVANYKIGGDHGTNALLFRRDGTEKLRMDNDGITVTGTVSDSKGDLRKIIFKQESSAYTLVAADAGKAIEIASGGITVPVSVFVGGDAITILNDSGSDQTITQGSGVTMFNAGSTDTGNRTLAGRGMATVYFVNSSTCYISGAGLS